MQPKDYYQILGVEKTADSKQIKEAYRDQAFQFHPDRNTTNPEASEKMKQLNEAYAVLSDADKKRKYDAMQVQFGASAYRQFRQRYSEQDIFSGSDINHVFEEMAKSSGVRGFDEIFRECYGKGYQSFEFKRPGIYAKGFFFKGPWRRAQVLRRPFSLYNRVGKLSQFLMNKISSETLPQRGEDIYDVIRLTPEHARNGGPYAYMLKKKSKKLVVKIPPAIRDGQRIRLAGMGEDGRGGGKPGNLYLKVQLQKSLFAKLKGFILGGN